MTDSTDYMKIFKTLKNPKEPSIDDEIAAELAAELAAEEKKEELRKKAKEDSSKIENLVGLKEVKEMFAQLKIQAEFFHMAKKRGKKLDNWYMHMLFTGNPGVGKTTVARLVASELHKCGLLEKDDVVEISRKDVCNRDSWGSSQDSINEFINEARGGVLFVDEAYSLVSSERKDDPGVEVMTTIMTAMENLKDELVVILAGYKKDIKKLIEINDGIASRIGFTFDFADYSAEELTEIAKKDIEHQGFFLKEDALELLKDTFAVFSGRKNLGNGRFAKKISQHIIRKHGEMLLGALKDESETIADDIFDYISTEAIPSVNEIIANLTNKEDFSYYADVDVKKIKEEEDKNPLAFLNDINDMVGLAEIKKELKDFYTYLKFIQENKGKEGRQDVGNLHMLFLGNPGTGKTTVARIIAKILYRVGLTRYDIFKEVTRKDLVAEHVGHTALKTNKVIQSALGGVLFIDEAYSLRPIGENDFAKEAIDEIVKAMSDYKDDLVVIFAGYPMEMNEFIETNSGIRSRIGYQFVFEDYTDNELVEMFKRLISKEGFKLSEEETIGKVGEKVTAEAKIRKVMHYFAGCRNLGNGRFVDNFYSIVKKKHYLNLAAKPGFEAMAEEEKKELIANITCEDVPALQELISILPSGNNFIDPQRLTEADIMNSAYHEIGHAIVSVMLTNMVIDRISTVPIASGALAYVSYQEGDNAKNIVPDKQDILNRICTLMAGIAAEEVIGGVKSLGGGSDLPRARMLAERIIYAGRSKLEFKYIPVSQNTDIYSSEEFIQEVERILKDEYNRAKRIILENKEIVINLAKTAAQEGILEKDRVEELLKDYNIIV